MIATPTFRVFISAVTGELATYRQEVARVLGRKGLEVRDQEHFSLGPATLLERLRDYIQQCQAIILLVGERCGALPTDEHAAALGAVPTYDRYRAATGQPFASYTQWELLLAKQYGKKTYVFLTDPTRGFVPNTSTHESANLRTCQDAYRAWIKRTGEHYDTLTTPAKLIEDVLVLPFPDLGQPKPIFLPYPSLGRLFKGREGFLAQLSASLVRTAEGHATAIVGKALHGLGGVGKTRLAVEYAWRYRENYSALFFLPAQAPQDLRHNLAGLAGPLVLDLPENAAAEEEVRLVAVLCWLGEHPGWFLIVDNVDTLEAAAAAEEMLARLHGGQVLLTGRLTQWSAAVEPLELNVLGPADAAAFLLERTQRGRRMTTMDAMAAAELGTELDGLALALEQAGAYIVQQHMSLTDYLRDWRTHEPAAQRWNDARLTKYPRSIAVTWQTTMENLGSWEAALLRLLAWLAPAPVPLFMLKGDKAEALWRDAVALQQQEWPASDPESRAMRAALAALANYSMVRWNAEREAVVMHRVVQEILRWRLSPEARGTWQKLGLRLLCVADPGDPTVLRTWPAWDFMSPHIAAALADEVGPEEPAAGLMNETDRDMEFARASPLLNGMGKYLLRRGRFTDAQALLFRVLNVTEKALGPDHPDVANTLKNLGHLLGRQGRFADAEQACRRSLAIKEKAVGLDHCDVADTLNNLGVILQEQGRYADAEPYFHRALAIREKAQGLDHPDVAIILNNLAILLGRQGWDAAAEPLCRRALAIRESALGPNHPDVATTLNNLALLLQAHADACGAESQLRRALAIQEGALGPDHPDVAITLSNLALLLGRQGRQPDAEWFCRRALAIREGTLEPDHPAIALTRDYLALLQEEREVVASRVPLRNGNVVAVCAHQWYPK